MRQETVFHNGKIYTADAKLPVVHSFAVRGGRFAAVNCDPDEFPNAERVDLNGSCVVPGLVDSHCHIVSGIRRASMNVINVDSDILPEELGAALEAKASEGEGTLTAMGIDLTRGRFSADDLDAAFPSRPVVVFSLDGHAMLLNHAAMARLGIDKETPDCDENSYFARDGRGEPTGLVIEIPAMMRCAPLVDDHADDREEAALAELFRKYASLGYTTVFDAMSADGSTQDVFPLLKRFDDAGKMTMRLSASFCYHGGEGGDPSGILQRMKELRDGYTSGNIRADTLKMIADGTLEEHSALLFEPYADQPQKSGSELIRPDDMLHMAQKAAFEGFSVHIHAIGDRAVSNALDVLCALGPVSGTKTVAHNQLYRPEDVERIARAGDIFFQTTPHWITADDYTQSRLGDERYLRQFPVGTMLKNGVTVSFGSDACTDMPAANAFEGMYDAVARGVDPAGLGLYPPATEGISRQEALTAYTIAGARQLGWEKETGSITPGKSADFLVLDHDIINCPLSELKQTRVIQTIFRGNTIYNAQ